MGMLAAASRPGPTVLTPVIGASEGFGPDQPKRMASEQAFSFETLVPPLSGAGPEDQGAATASKTVQEALGDQREDSDAIAGFSAPLAPQTMLDLAEIGLSKGSAIIETSGLRTSLEPPPQAMTPPAAPAAGSVAPQTEADSDAASPPAQLPLGVAAPGAEAAGGSSPERGLGRDAATLEKRLGTDKVDGGAAGSQVASDQTALMAKTGYAETAQGTKTTPGARAALAATPSVSPTEPSLDAGAAAEQGVADASGSGQDKGGAAQPPALASGEPGPLPSPLAKTEGFKTSLGTQDLPVPPDSLGTGSSPDGDRSRQDERLQDRQLEGWRRIEAGGASERTAGFVPTSKAEAGQAPVGVTGEATAVLETANAEGASGASLLEAPAALDKGSGGSPAPISSSPAAPARLSPHQQVGQQITRRMDDGSMHFDLRLDPPELGQVSVKLEVGADGAVKAAIGADTPMALAELVRGARELERSLAQAGLSVERGALTFDLHDRSGGGEDQSDRPRRQSRLESGSGEAAAPSARPLTASLWRAARVDLIA